MIILDSDHLSFLEWGGSEGRLIGAYLDKHAPNQRPTTTIINYVEQLRGWIGRLNSVHAVAEQLRIYDRIDKQRKLYEKMDVIPFDDAAAAQYQQIAKLKLRIGTMDLKIASIALAHEATLLSRNAIDFSKIPRLKWHDATH